MFAKLLFIITIVGALACALLVIRQQRIDTFHEISKTHQRLLDHERTLWQMRSEIASRCRPQQVRLAMNQLGGEWTPLPARPSTIRPADDRAVFTASMRTTTAQPPPQAKSDRPSDARPDETARPPSTRTPSAKSKPKTPAHKPPAASAKKRKPSSAGRRE